MLYKKNAIDTSCALVLQISELYFHIFFFISSVVKHPILKLSNPNQNRGPKRYYEVLFYNSVTDGQKHACVV